MVVAFMLAKSRISEAVSGAEVDVGGAVVVDDRTGVLVHRGVDHRVGDLASAPRPRTRASTCPAPRSPTRRSGWVIRDGSYIRCV